MCISVFDCCVASMCSAFLYLLCCENLQRIFVFGCVVNICSTSVYLVVL